jgi:uncharacterized membrane protein (UPF0182 family)
VSVPQNSADVGAVTEYRAVIVSYNDRSVLEPTIGEALAKLFPGFEGDLGEEIDEPTEPDETTDPDTTEPDPSEPSSDDTPTALLARADELFIEADAALADSDLGLYQRKIDEARQLIADAVALLDN